MLPDSAVKMCKLDLLAVIRRKCLYDNAAMENLFGVLKSECLSRIKFDNRAEVEQAVAESVQFYNFERMI